MDAQKIIPFSIDNIMIISQHFEKQVLRSPIQPLHSVLRVLLAHTRRLRSLREAASSQLYVANGNMTDARMFQIFTLMSPVWQVWHSQISNERRNIPTRPTPKGSPCTVARETPWRGCASDSLGPAVDTGDEGDGRFANVRTRVRIWAL